MMYIDAALMTALDVVFRYATPPGARELRALDGVRDVYGIRRLTFNERDRTVRVEYDASRLNADVVAGLLRDAGLDITGSVQLV
jgi:hypothetical protein